MAAVEKEEDNKVLSEHLSTFKKIISSKLDPSKKVALFSHRCPDPDAIGSMMGMAWLLQNAFGVESTSFFDGQIAHPQNGAICNLLDPQLIPVQEYEPENYCLNILLDTVPANAGIGDKKVDFDIVVDHHKEIPNGTFKGLFINLRAGSCCATVLQLFDLSNRFFEHDVDHDRKVATAMIAGIVTDTENMLSDDTTSYEFEAFSRLFEFRDQLSLKDIVSFKRPKFWIDTKAAAVASAKIDSEGLAVVGLGIIPEKQRDLIADMADDMIKWMSVETAIVFAIVQGDRIEGSVRSDNASVSVSDFCKRLAGSHGQGGGKQGKGAYKYDLAGAGIDADEPEEIKTKLWEVIKEKEWHRITRLAKK